MPYIRRVPQVARTRRQRVTLAAYWVELNNLAMTPDQDIVTHVIRVHDLIQQIVLADASFTQYRNHDYMRMTLRRTLLPRDQQLLDEVWEGQINQNCYRNIIRAFLPIQIRRTLNRMMYNWGLPVEIAREIGRIASVDAIDWWRMEQLLAMRQQPPPPSPQHRNDAVERFRKMNPQEFSGGDNPMKAEEWIKSLEAIFEYLHFDDNERVSCAIFMLTTDARTWWESARVTVDVSTLTWVKLKEMFYNKYFTADVKARKIQDFLELKQNGMSVGEYVRRFEQGCRFVPFIAEDENLKKNRFLTGLNPRVRSMVWMSAANTFSEMVDKALLADEDQKEISREIQQKRQTFKSGTSSSGPLRRTLPRNFNRSGGPGSARAVRPTPYTPRLLPGSQPRPMLGNQPRCNKCGRFHTGECPPDLRTCYICHKQGHIASNCSQVQKRGPGRVPARVYTMTQEEADRKDSTVICGNVSLLGLVTYVLIDSGATHSFISKTLVESLADSEGPSKAGTGSDSCGPQEYYISFDSPSDSAGEN
ncbi:hypothetical protein DKX38_022100 [Salix brachista]|uniref:CCHC-type domain-containing protein n=1 Tax=Salix brachista TaxID=2182728 RepID=A0A5N5JYR3_9ROSI|nr:hypothetical protein DKX38_022100 [Salix brachista]